MAALSGMEAIKPQTTHDVCEAVRAACEAGEPLEIVGRGSKLGLGRPVAAARRLDLSGLSGVTLYEPNELVLSARAGSPLEDIEALLEENGQMLAFEPPDARALFGAENKGAIGGAVASGLSGPRRVFSGAARDFVLGVSGVSGRGEPFKSGGRVVKNVTGYDLSKLMTGSFGTLAALTDVTLKVSPKPECVRTVSVVEPDVAAAADIMRAVTASPFAPTGVGYAPIARNGDYAVHVRLEGSEKSVSHRAASVVDLLRRDAAVDEASEIWSRLAVAADFDDEDATLWKAALAPAAFPALIARNPEARFLVDGAGATAWLAFDDPDAVPEAPDAAEEARFYVMRASEARRRRLPVFPDQPAPLARLSAAVKRAFDPRGVLNPGKMYAEI